MFCHYLSAAGKPPLGTLLSEDPYFILKDVGGAHLHVLLRISRLAQLIGNAGGHVTQPRHQ
jgi:hypothetical protein